jgi:alkaline phosphatase
MKKACLIIILLFAVSMTAGAFGPEDVYYDDCDAQTYQKASCSDFNAEGAGEAKNVIIVIGDGMGINQIFAGRTYLNGPDTPFEWEKLPHQGLVTTCAIGSITDSAASATAMGTGHKTQNNAIGMKYDGGLEIVPNITDLVHHKKAAGIVTTTYVWDATPAGFTVHSDDRYNDRQIANQMVNDVQLEVILGGGAKAFEKTNKIGSTDVIETARGIGYTVVRTQDELLAVDAKNTDKILGLFANGKMKYEVKRPGDTTEPHLSQMTRTAIDVLKKDPRGFFLMIEGARIDHSSHRVSIDKLVGEMTEFNKTMDIVLDFVKENPDTLLIVTADHECGGIELRPGNYKKGDEIKVSWGQKISPFYAGHSAQRVPIFATGPNAGAVKEHIDNTEIMCIIMNAFEGSEKEKIDSAFPYFK